MNDEFGKDKNENPLEWYLEFFISSFEKATLMAVSRGTIYYSVPVGYCKQVLKR